MGTGQDESSTDKALRDAAFNSASAHDVAKAALQANGQLARLSCWTSMSWRGQQLLPAAAMACIKCSVKSETGHEPHVAVGHPRHKWDVRPQPALCVLIHQS